ncbi:WRKY DNA-binding transcription factor 70-like [Abrus precatorius]|uniref:WRKY DNA-binding transcription factor 70-like n=1 Tax=Abrus precatorius TaxID=3816 RepID=A0A8B8K2P2_ABRPR|nr:WRKY DNA-binding transcription factor 70-like [Abrus precatorius]
MNHRKAIEELVRGREFANQLREVIHGDDESGSGIPFAQHLVNNVLSSFTNTLFLLDNYPTVESHDMQQRNSCFLSPSKSEDSQESCKSFTSKNRRGCYKRRKTTETWEKVSKTLIDDGHQWRKYGQKAILTAKYSRNYYRCTHKYDQSCQATKQVQRIQEEPPLYRTTYYGQHTCKDLLNSEIILDSTSTPDTSILLSFNNTFPNPTKQECPFLSSSFPSSSVNKEEIIPSSSSDNYLLSPEPILDDSSWHNNVALSSSNQRDVMSSVLCDSVDLDDVFQSLVGF